METRPAHQLEDNVVRKGLLAVRALPVVEYSKTYHIASPQMESAVLKVLLVNLDTHVVEAVALQLAVHAVVVMAPIVRLAPRAAEMVAIPLAQCVVVVKVRFVHPVGSVVITDGVRKTEDNVVREVALVLLGSPASS